MEDPPPQVPWEPTEPLEEALDRERDFSRTILDTAQGLIVVLDVEGRIQVFNRACENLTGYTEAEVKGRHLWDVVVPPDKTEERRERFRLLKQGHITGRVESVWLTREKSPRLISWQTAILRNRSGAIIGVVATGIDITDKRRDEDAMAELNRRLAEANRELEMRVAERTAQLVHAERLATLGAVTAGVLHEVRNPLVTLSGYHRLLRKCIEDLESMITPERLNELRERFQAAEKAGSAMVEVLESMLAFARKDPMAAPFDVAAAIQDSRRLLQAPLSGVTTRCDAVSGLTVKGVRSQLVQVLTNLLANAVDALRDHPSPTVSIRSFPQDGWAVMEVSDNGPGVPEALRPQLFRPFFTTKPARGTGLGLMISRHIIESMGGRLSHQPGPAGGACFLIKLPLAEESRP